jgi:hypothetical protein
MASSHHRYSGLIALFSLAALAALGCSTGGETGAEADEAPTEQALGPLGCGPAHWLTAASMPAVRERHSAVRLENGKVLVSGGSGPSSVDLYNPAKDKWKTSAALPLDTDQTSMALLPGGKVLISPGGVVYRPSTGATTAVPLTPGEAVEGWSFAGSTLTSLPSGLVLRTGGSDGDHVLKEAVLYDASSNTWSSAPNMAVTRQLHTATLLVDGRVLVVGGYTTEGDYDLPTGRTSAEIYDPATGTWSAAASTHMPRMQHTATLLPSGHVLVIGGGGEIHTDFTSDDDGDHWVTIPADVTAEIYNPASNTWTLTAAPSLAYGPGSAAALTRHGRVMAIGSHGAETYKEASDSWHGIADPTDARSWLTATTLEDDSVLIVGGQGLASAEIYTKACALP